MASHGNVSATDNDLYSIKIHFNGKILTTIEAPRSAVITLRNREKNPTYYLPISIDNSWNHDKLKGTHETFIPGPINIYSDDIYARLRDSNNNICEDLRDRGNQQSALNEGDDILCTQSVNKLIKNDDELLKSWITKIEEAENLIDKENNQLKKDEEEIVKLTKIYKRSTYKYDQCLKAYENNQHGIMILDQEQTQAITLLENLSILLKNSIIKSDFDLWDLKKNKINDQFSYYKEKLLKPKYESEKHSKIGNDLNIKLEKLKHNLKNKINSMLLLQQTLDSKGLNLIELKFRITKQIDSVKALIKGGKKKKIRKSKNIKKKGGKKVSVKKILKKKSRIIKNVGGKKIKINKVKKTKK